MAETEPSQGQFSSLDEKLEAIERDYLPEFIEAAKGYYRTASHEGHRDEPMVRSMSPVLTYLSSKRQEKAAELIAKTVQLQWETIDQMKSVLERMEAQSDGMARQTTAMRRLTWVLVFFAVVQIAIALAPVVAEWLG